MRVTIVFLSLLVLSSSAAAQVGKETLGGIDSLGVVVEELPSDVGTDLPRSTLETDIELRLRQSGVRVAAASAQRLRLAVHAMKTEPGGIVFVVQLTLEQPVVLRGDFLAYIGDETASPPPFYDVPTWRSVGNIARCRTESFPAYCRDIVRNNVDQFLNDFLAANPR